MSSSPVGDEVSLARVVTSDDKDKKTCPDNNQ
jgi:hypothetical protein